MKTRAVNLRKEAYDVYIGRAGKGQDGYFGNPYSVRMFGKDALSRFKLDFYQRVDMEPEFRRRVMGLKGKRLGCFCKPGPCHGDIIAEYVEEQSQNEAIEPNMKDTNDG